MNKKVLIVWLLALMILPLSAQEAKIWWNFEKIEEMGTNQTVRENFNPQMSPPAAYVVSGKTREAIKGQWDSLEGNWALAAGIKGQGLRLDGFTSCLRATDTTPLKLKDELTLEAWIALGEYPLNWCPVITTEADATDGYRLMIGPYGQVSMEVAIDGQWRSSTTEREIMPLRQWMHLIGVYKAESKIEVYVNGELKAAIPIRGRTRVPKSNFLLGMVATPQKPSDIVSSYGTLPDYLGLEGIIDEVRVYDVALTADQVKTKFQQVEITDPDLQPKKLPRLENNPGKFGAFYTTLKYYPAWDKLWPVADQADVVVTFDKSPVKFIFWRGTRYSPVWVTENELWMADQSVEAWNDEEGCFEHMQDRHCRLSSVRIIESNQARVVVHWRYAPVSAYEHTWRRDPKTGWECWIDEYYFIYPDQSAVRKVSWKKGTLGEPRQFQESEVLLQPEQRLCEAVEKDFARVADYKGTSRTLSFVEDPSRPPYGPFSWDKHFDYTIQQFNFKAKNRPFICFEPPNKMWLRYRSLDEYSIHTGYDHWPVGQARSDGRRSVMPGRPSHTIGFPISDPVIHETDNREFWSGLYGMNDLAFDELIKFGKSWAYPAELVLKNKNFKSDGYYRSERCYKIYNQGQKPEPVSFTLRGSKNSPVFNPAFYIENWNGQGARVLIDGQEIKVSRIGIKETLTGQDLIIFIPLIKETKVEIEIIPAKIPVT